MTNSNGTRRRRPGQGLCLPCESLQSKYSVVVPIRFKYMIGSLLVLVLLALILTAPNPHMNQQTVDGKKSWARYLMVENLKHRGINYLSNTGFLSPTASSSPCPLPGCSKRIAARTERKAQEESEGQSEVRLEST